MKVIGRCSRIQGNDKANCLAGILRVDRRNDSYRGVIEGYG